MKPPTSQMEPLTVALRVRPLNSSECKAGVRRIAHTVDKSLVVLMDPNEDSDDILRANRSRERKFTFDNAFGPHCSQTDVYRSTVTECDVIGRILSGYNCTVFAYGATGAGKTYTMLGTSCVPGIMVLTLNDLFQKLEATKEDSYYRVTMAYLEIYNEVIRDLLCPSSGLLDLRESADGAVVVSGLLEVETSSTSEVMKLLQRGNIRRTCEPTAVNETSSRSHAVLKVTVEQRSRMLDIRQKVRTGILFMVDLAGSERAAISKNRGKRMIEGAHINRSLLALANCINALACNATSYVNYRDSKLTRLLKDALGGNCKTVMIAHISPTSSCFEESRNTLVYAERGKRIKNKLQQNVTSVSYHVTQYTWIIRELNSKLARLQSDGAVCPEVEMLCQQVKSLSKQERDFRQELLGVECQLLQNALDCQKHMPCIKLWEERAAAATPDSGTVVSPIEPTSVSTAREELASLTQDKQQLETLHCQLQKQLRTNKRETTRLHEKLSSCRDLSNVRKELVALQRHVCEVDAASVEHRLSAMLLSMQLAHKESSIDALLTLTTQLLALLKQHTLLEESASEAPLSKEYHKLASQHNLLATQLSADRPNLTKHLQLPAISRLSAKLYSSMTGSKSNLFAEEGLSDSISEIHLQTPPTSPDTMKQFSSLSLPATKPADCISLPKELSDPSLLASSTPPGTPGKQPTLFSRVSSSLPVPVPGTSKSKYHIQKQKNCVKLLANCTASPQQLRGCGERALAKRGRKIVTVEELSALASRGPISMARRVTERNNAALVKRTAAPKKKRPLRQEVRIAKVTAGSFASPYLTPVRHSGRGRRRNNTIANTKHL